MNTDEPVELTAELVGDLDRCEHGRHSIDNCLACPGGWSVGNHYAPQPGERVGTTLHGRPIVMPVRTPREVHNPAYVPPIIGSILREHEVPDAEDGVIGEEQIIDGRMPA